MGETTKIQWTDHTFNPWIGCHKVSDGCKHCYASEGTPARVSLAKGLPLWGVNAARKPKAESGWAEPERWFRAAVRDGVRRRVFCASQADVFEDRRVLDVHRERLWSLIEETAAGYPGAGRDVLAAPPARAVNRPGLEWLLLTKRPEAIMRLIPERWRAGLPPNVWIGTSVENQAAADERIPHLLRVPAWVRFLSLEPLLGPVDLIHRRFYLGAEEKHPTRLGIDWLIIGGESGPKARPCNVAWVRDLVRQGRDAGARVFVKQLGSSAWHDPNDGEGAERLRTLHGKGGDPAEWPEDLRMREFPVGGEPAARVA